MPRQKYMQPIAQRIAAMKDGTVFIVSDLLDIASLPTVNMALSRLSARGDIRRVMRGIYEKPRYSRLLGELVATDPTKTAYAIARKNRWSVAPTGEAALNLLRLSTQVPVVWIYASDGPYKEYSCGGVKISFRHTSNKEITGYSPITILLIQALRALGRKHVGETEIKTLQRNLSEENKKIALGETQGITSWIYDLIKQICADHISNEGGDS